MDEILKELYYSPTTGFTNAIELWRRAKQKDNKITQKYVKDWLKKQEIHQIKTKQTIKDRKIIPNTYQSFQIDITFYDQFKKQNNNYSALLTAINVGSRKAYVYPIKNKTQGEINRVLNLLLKEGKPDTITSDNEQTFINFFKKHDIKHFTSDPSYKGTTAVIERFNRTIRDKISQYQKVYRTKKYIDVLPQLVENYNTSKHTTTKKEPNKTTKEDQDLLRIKAVLQDEVTDDIKEGDKVRVLKAKGQFEKGSAEFTRGVYTVEKHEQNHYILRNPKGDLLKTRYQRKQIKPVSKAQGEEVEKFDVEKEHSTKEVQKQNKFERKQKQDFKAKDEVDKVIAGVVFYKPRLQPEREKRKAKPREKLNL